MSTRRLILLFAIQSLVLAACGSGDGEADVTTAPETGSDWDAVVEAAQAEGQAVWYGTEVETWTEALKPLFLAETGVEFVAAPRAATGAILERVSGEAAAGAVGGDVLLVADFTVWIDHPEWFVDLDTAGLPNYAAYPESAKWNNKCAIVTQNPAGILYNTDLVDEEHIPETWEDLLDPYWQGQMALTDPRSSPTYNSYMFLLEENYGPEFLEGIGAQIPDLFDSASPAAEQVAAGAYLVSFPSHYANSSAVRASGAPLELVIPPDPPTIGSVSCAGILANSPNPNAAKVMMNYLLSAEAQSAGCDAGVENASVLPNTTCLPLPPGWTAPPRDPETGQQIGQTDDEGRARILDLLGIG
jgi:iron(III) transport system substrate-binding protein